MTLADLKERCEAQGFDYAYGTFKETPEPPYIVTTTADSQVFHADDVVFYKKNMINLNYIYKNKNQAEIDKIENTILADITWQKSDESYLPGEEVWQITYFFEIGG